MPYLSFLILLSLLSFGAIIEPYKSTFENIPSSQTLDNEYQALVSATMGSVEPIEILQEDNEISNQEIGIDPLISYQELNQSQPNTLLKEHLTRTSQEIIQPSVPYVHEIQYSDFESAKKLAIQEHKYLLIKVEASNCQPCNRLNQLLQSNNHIKQMVNQHVQAVKIDALHTQVPMGLSTIGTPTVFLIQPEEGRVVMKLEGNEAIEDLEASLSSFVDEGYTEGIALR